VRQPDWFLGIVQAACTATVIAGSVPAAHAQGIRADHTTLDAASIPEAALNDARALRMSLDHASVGGNIRDALTAMGGADPIRYGLGDWLFRERGNPGWKAKADEFSAWVGAHASEYDVMQMKLCYIDAGADFAYYRDVMVAIEAAWGMKLIVWWTMPITTAGDAQRDAFNAQVRQHCASGNRPLFDLADIESHDGAGAPVFDSGHEAMYPDWSSDGGHLNEAGAGRAARAMWWLMSRLAGWDPAVIDAGAAGSAGADGGFGGNESGGAAGAGGGEAGAAGTSGNGSAGEVSDSGGAGAGGDGGEGAGGGVVAGGAGGAAESGGSAGASGAAESGGSAGASGAAESGGSAGASGAAESGGSAGASGAAESGGSAGAGGLGQGGEGGVGGSESGGHGGAAGQETTGGAPGSGGEERESGAGGSDAATDASAGADPEGASGSDGGVGGGGAATEDEAGGCAVRPGINARGWLAGLLAAWGVWVGWRVRRRGWGAS